MEINQPQVNIENVDEALQEKAEYEYWAKQKEALDRLEKNEDFKLVVLNCYFKDFVCNQTSMLAHDYTRSQGTRPVIMEQLVAVSALQDYFRTVKMLGSEMPDEGDED